VAHAALLIVSGLAFATFLAPPVAVWIGTPANQQIASLMFRYGGQATVLLGALAAFVHAVSRMGARNATLILLSGFGISLAVELVGTSTGYPFGPYSYTTQLGYLVGGRVPFSIPTSWFFMLYASLAITGRLVRADDTQRGKAAWAAVAAIVLTAWDVSMDPAMVSTTHWLWHLPGAASMGFTERVFLSNAFYGMPITNWLGWLLTGFVIARVMVALVPPSAWRRDVSPTVLPFVLYAANGLFPVLICAGRHMWVAAILGALAMLAPLFFALRHPHAKSRAAELAMASADL
jgi:putative membrane protein